MPHHHENYSGAYSIPDNYANLSELAAPEPEQNPDEQHQQHQEFLEDIRIDEQNYEQHECEHERDAQSSTDRAQRLPQAERSSSSHSESALARQGHVSIIATHLYIVSHLLLFTILGVLKRQWTLLSGLRKTTKTTR